MQIPKGKKRVTSRNQLSIFVLVASFCLGSILCQSSALVSSKQSRPIARRLASAFDNHSRTELVQAPVPIGEKKAKEEKKEKHKKKAKMPEAERNRKRKHEKPLKKEFTDSGDRNP